MPSHVGVYHLTKSGIEELQKCSQQDFHHHEEAHRFYQVNIKSSPIRNATHMCIYFLVRPINCKNTERAEAGLQLNKDTRTGRNRPN